jgi:hypothetical protein|tara:strand:- start:184 stop:1884 length:1701 start_codon:yes stop_codon:yes gene_type:complete
MAAGPAEVSFPGDKNRKKRIRMRGIKKASKEIQQRLDRNLEALLDDPEIFLPEIRAELGKPRKDAVAATLKEVDSVSQKRHDRRWLTKRMTKRRGDLVCRSLAGSLLAAGDANISTVSVYNSPIYGTTSYVRRGNGKQSHMVGIQNFTNPRMRLLVWDDHAKAGNWFFSWPGGFVCSGKEPKAPAEWVDECLDSASIDLSGEDVRWSRGLEKEVVESARMTDSGWVRLSFDEVVVGITGSALAKTAEDPFIASVALGMMPPKLSAVARAEWMWRPQGWPDEMALPEEGREKLDEVLLAWMNLALPDDKLVRACKDSILGSIEEGYIAGSHWFAPDARSDFLGHLQGGDVEREALAEILDSLDGGARVRSDGVILDMENEVIRFEDSACHPVLVALWPEHGMEVLESMFGLTESEAESVHQRQTRRKQGFGAFLRELRASVSTAQRLQRLPWQNELLPSPLAFADALVRKATEDGISSTVALCRKAKKLDAAMGWAWLVVHDRTESDAWRFDQASRDKGGDWTPALAALWKAADALLLKDDLDAKSDYIEAMKQLAEASGTSGLAAV